MPPAPMDPAEVAARLWDGVSGIVGWDVGANTGMSVARMTGLFNGVVAFEPAEESFTELRANYGGHPAVVIHQMAVSDHDGELTVAVRAAPIQTGQLVAVEMPYSGEHAGEACMANWGPETGRRQVPCRSIDSLTAEFTEPDFIKVDTEGHELQVLSGARQLLCRRHTGWLVEFHRDDLLAGCTALLSQNGYQVEVIRHPHYPEGSHMWHHHGWLRAQAPQ